MKLSHLQQIVTFMQPLRKINAIYRISDNTIKIAFDRSITLYFNMHKGQSHIFMCDDIKRSKVYQAPFDVILAKQFNRSTITDISLLGGDKVLRITAEQSSAYKASRSVLQLEFTGKYTNAIILDQDEIVLEALRHIDAATSYRIIKVGQRLEALPSPSYQAKEFPIADVRAYLHETYEHELHKRLDTLKKQKTTVLQRQLKKVQKLLTELEDEESLAQEVELQQYHGNLVLANLHRVKPYLKEVELMGFEGEPVTITLPQHLPSASAISDYFFRLGKKAKQKMKNLHIERTNLEQKAEHLRHFIQTVTEAKDIATIEMLFPAKSVNVKSKSNDAIETFWIEGHKVMLGKNERGNIQLLQNARARDLWLHMKERPSTHVIIVTDKQNLPESVILGAARLCVDFTVFEKGSYLVDYTPRREVKIQDGANVLYNNFKTISVEKG